MPFASLPTGIDMYYEIEGSGDPLLLIMGTAADHSTWAGQVAAVPGSLVASCQLPELLVDYTDT